MPRLAAFPFIQGFAFGWALALWSSHRGAAVLCFGMASLALCFSVHIAFHEAVHQKGFSKSPVSWIFDSVMTLWMGMPLTGYRWHHLNHHRYNNTLEDYSCTWQKKGAGEIVPRSVWAYALGWPMQSRLSQQRMNEEEAQGRLPADLSRRMAFEKYVLLFAVVGVGFYRWQWAIAYLLCVYAGWVLVALENYVQHPPVAYGVDSSTSYYGAVYNIIFCKNGYHAEHHRAAQVTWLDLKLTPGARTIRKPYLLEPFF